MLLLLSGCVGGPQYHSTAPNGSASIEGPPIPSQGAADGTCGIHITGVDGLAFDFTASSPGLTWPGYVGLKPMYLAPGWHTLELNISYSDPKYGNVGGGAVGEVGVYAAGSKPMVKMELAANHIYRITATLIGRAIEVTLWDETSGIGNRTSVRSWTTKGNGIYMEER
jgi:hypothetical protein